MACKSPKSHPKSGASANSATFAHCHYCKSRGPYQFAPACHKSVRRPPRGPTRQLTGRMRVTSPRSCGPRPKGIRPLQGRGTSVALSGGVAPGYYLVPLQGTKNLPFGLTPRHPVSDITDSSFRPSMLRMTCGGPQGTRCRLTNRRR
jgi:hypothetical protein